MLGILHPYSAAGVPMRLPSDCRNQCQRGILRHFPLQGDSENPFRQARRQLVVHARPSLHLRSDVADDTSVAEPILTSIHRSQPHPKQRKILGSFRGRIPDNQICSSCKLIEEDSE